jgi:hypothetical protein
MPAEDDVVEVGIEANTEDDEALEVGLGTNTDERTEDVTADDASPSGVFPIHSASAMVKFTHVAAVRLLYKAVYQ